MIYFIHGPDRQTARDAAIRIATERDPQGADTSWIDGRESTIDRLITAVGTVSFFGTPRVVVVTDWLGRGAQESTGSRSNGPNDTRTAKADPELQRLLSVVPDDHVLILLEPSLAGPPAAIKSSSLGVTVIASEPPRGARLLAWIESAARNAGSQIDRRSAQHLAETIYPQTWDRAPNNPRFDRPPDLALLSSEIEKLALAAHPDPIGIDHIDALVPGGADQRLFRFLDAALAGDLRLAVDELDRLLAAGEEPAMVLAQLLGQIELSAVAGSTAGKDAASIARDLGTVSPSRMSAIVAGSARQPRRDISPVTRGVETDRRLKTGRLRQPADALHDLVLALAEASPARQDVRPR